MNVKRYLIILSIFLTSGVIPTAMSQVVSCAEVPTVVVRLTLATERSGVYRLARIEEASEYSRSPDRFSIGQNQTVATLAWIEDAIEIRLGQGLPQYLQLRPGRGVVIPANTVTLKVNRPFGLDDLLSAALCGDRKIDGRLVLQRGTYTVRNGSGKLVLVTTRPK